MFLELFLMVGLYEPLSRWTVALDKPFTALERHKQNVFSGLTKVEDSFVIGTEAGSLERRLISTGEVVWTARLKGAVQGAWFYDGTSLYGGDVRGNVYRVNPTTGGILWSQSLKGSIFSQPLVSDRHVFFMSSVGILTALDKATGQWQWQQSDSRASSSGLWSYAGPVMFGNKVVAGFASGSLLALVADTGELVWKESFSSADISAEGLSDVKSVLVSDSVLIAASFSGDTKAWEEKGGSKKLLWQKRISMYAPATVSGNLVLLSSRDGHLICLDLQTGYERWRYLIPRGLPSRPSIEGGNVWVTTTDGEVFVFDLSTGKKLAQKPTIESSYWFPPLVIDSRRAIVVSSQGIIRFVSLAETLPRSGL